MPSDISSTSTKISAINLSPHGQNGRLFTDDIFRFIFLNEKFCILIKILLKFVPKGPIDNNPTLVQIMAWRRIGDKTLFEPMLTHICGTWGRWFNQEFGNLQYLVFGVLHWFPAIFLCIKGLVVGQHICGTWGRWFNYEFGNFQYLVFGVLHWFPAIFLCIKGLVVGQICIIWIWCAS